MDQVGTHRSAVVAERSGGCRPRSRKLPQPLVDGSGSEGFVADVQDKHRHGPEQLWAMVTIGRLLFELIGLSLVCAPMTVDKTHVVDYGLKRYPIPGSVGK